MAEVCGRDQGCAVVGARDEVGAIAEFQGQRDQGRVVGHCRDRQNVVCLTLERVQVRTRRRQGAQGIVVRAERSDMRRRPPGPVRCIEISTRGDQRGNLFGVPGVRRRVQSGVAGNVIGASEQPARWQRRKSRATRVPIGRNLIVTAHRTPSVASRIGASICPRPAKPSSSALHALLQTQPAPVLRGEVLPERVPAAGLLILRDGDPGEPAVTLSPLRYHYQHRAEVEAVVQSGTGRDAAFDALAAGVGTALAADRTLGGLCDWVEAEAPRPVDLPVDGAATLKAAVIPIVLHYSTSDPLA